MAIPGDRIGEEETYEDTDDTDTDRITSYPPYSSASIIDISSPGPSTDSGVSSILSPVPASRSWGRVSTRRYKGAREEITFISSVVLRG